VEFTTLHQRPKSVGFVSDRGLPDRNGDAVWLTLAQRRTAYLSPQAARISAEVSNQESESVPYGGPRKPEEIRQDALRMGAKKLSAGCASCAESYFTLARKHGASDVEVERAKQGAAQAQGIGRREFLQRAGTIAAGASLLASGGSLLGQARQARAGTAPDGADAAWCLGSTASSERHLVGFDAQGVALGDLDATEKLILRSADGRSLHLIWSDVSGATATTVVNTYDAASGLSTGSATGSPVDLGFSGGSDAVWPAVSNDGTMLAVFHQTTRVTSPNQTQVSKVLRHGSAVVGSLYDTVLDESLELFDLTRGASVGLAQMPSFPGYFRGAQVLFTPDGSQVHVLKEDDSREQPQVFSSFATFDVAGGSPALTSSVPGYEGPNQLPPLSNLLSPYAWVMPSGGVIARVASLGLVQLIDTASNTVTQVDIRPAQRRGAKAFSLAAACAGDGSALYVADSYAGIVQRVSASGAGVLSSYRTSTRAGAAAPVTAAPSAQTLALSPDGTTLYFVDCINGGLAVLDASTLALQSALLTGLPLRAVWAAPDGTDVFVQSADGRTVYVSDHGAQITATVQSSALLSAFVCPGQLTA
jgi:hypothetical protein